MNIYNVQLMNSKENDILQRSIYGIDMLLDILYLSIQLIVAA